MNFIFKGLAFIVIALGAFWCIGHQKEILSYVEKASAGVTKPDLEQVVEIRKEEKYEIVLAADTIPITTVLKEFFKRNIEDVEEGVSKTINPIRIIKEKMGIEQEKQINTAPEIGKFRVTKQQYTSLSEEDSVDWGLTTQSTPSFPYYKPAWCGIWVKEKLKPEIIYSWINKEGKVTEIDKSVYELLEEDVNKTLAPGEPSLVRNFKTEPIEKPEPVNKLEPLYIQVYFYDPSELTGYSFLGYSIESAESQKDRKAYKLRLNSVFTDNTVSIGKGKSGKRFEKGDLLFAGEEGFWARLASDTSVVK